MLIALAIGAISYIYSSYTQNVVELEVSSRFLIATSIILVFSILISITLRGYMITEISDAFIVVILYWLLVPILNAVIYCYTIGLSFVDSLFESVSGFTGTGLTIISKPEMLPYTVLLWRATTQWIGEISVVVFSGALLPHIHRILGRIYIAERGVRLAPTIISTTRRMLSIYALFTLAGIVMLMYSGMEFLDSVIHSMTGIATGGMSSRSQSIAFWYRAYGPLILITSAVIMILGGLNFGDLYHLLRGKINKFIKSLEVRWFVYLTAILTLITIVITYIEFKGDHESIVIALYHALSGLTTTGFQAGDISKNPEILKFVFILAMAIGGATFSTAGGIKIKRMVVAIKFGVWSITKLFLPERVYIVRKIDGEVLSDEDAVSVYGFVLLYILTTIVSSVALYVILSIYGYIQHKSYIDVLFETVSALSCVGLSAGITSISMPLEAKLLLMTNMFLGRLEFLPIYIIASYIYKMRVTL